MAIRVLLVEDNDVYRSSLELLLGLQEGFEVVGAVGSGAEAADAARELAADVVVMDYRLPGLDGAAATRAVIEASGAAVVCLTAEASADERDGDPRGGRGRPRREGRDRGGARGRDSERGGIWRRRCLTPAAHPPFRARFFLAGVTGDRHLAVPVPIRLPQCGSPARTPRSCSTPRPTSWMRASGTPTCGSSRSTSSSTARRSATTSTSRRRGSTSGSLPRRRCRRRRSRRRQTSSPPTRSSLRRASTASGRFTSPRSSRGPSSRRSVRQSSSAATAFGSSTPRRPRSQSRCSRRRSTGVSGRGTTDEEIAELVERFKATNGVVFTVATLEYLQKGGRIGKAQALAGSLLNVKPILTVEDGVIVPARARPRTPEGARGVREAVRRRDGGPATASTSPSRTRTPPSGSTC